MEVGSALSIEEAERLYSAVDVSEMERREEVRGRF
jgi:hypothetical protein